MSVEDAAANPANNAITTADGSMRRHDGSANDSCAGRAGAARAIDPLRAHNRLSVMEAP